MNGESGDNSCREKEDDKEKTCCREPEDMVFDDGESSGSGCPAQEENIEEECGTELEDMVSDDGESSDSGCPAQEENKEEECGTEPEDMVSDDGESSDNSCPAQEDDKEEACGKETEDATAGDRSNFELSELKTIIEKHFVTIEGLVRYSKSKDDNVLSLSKQLQEYREGFTKNIYKRIALDLIAFREDCEKSLKDIKGSEMQDETAIKYLDILCADFYDLMENIGISQKGESFFYNGKPLYEEPESQTCSQDIQENPSDEEIPAECGGPGKEEKIQEDNQPVEDIAGLLSYLKTAEENIAAILKDNSRLDALVAGYIKKDSVYEEKLYQAVLYPTMRRITELYKALQEANREINESPAEGNCVTVYADSLSEAAESIEQILFCLDVSIDRQEHDCYDAKTDRILKYILTDDSDLNAKIAARYTDCYVMGEKTVYPAKVDVYKAK